MRGDRALARLNGQLKACPCSLGQGQASYLIACGKEFAAPARRAGSLLEPDR